MEEYHVAPYDEERGTGIVRHALIRVGFHTGQILVCLVINADSLPHADKLTERLLKIQGMTSVCLNKMCIRDSYNAVLRAELDVSYRKNHSMMVNYVYPGMDAMVAPQDNSDFKFVNSSNHPIYIEAYVVDDRICINIWGIEERDANRSVRSVSYTHLKWQHIVYGGNVS